MIIKNSNLRRILFENRYKILAIIIAIILFFGVRKILSQFLIESNKNSTNNVSVLQNSDYEPEQTMVIGNDVSEEKQDDITSLMDNFISYCNSKQIEEAYNLLTDECKEELFSNNIENFKTNYVEKIFTTTKTYSMQSWINYSNPTYKVKITQDVLATGSTGEEIEDYYTIVKTTDGYKINLNSYVGETAINNESTR